MDFLDSLKSIKEEMQKEQKFALESKDKIKNFHLNEKQIAQELFQKEQRLKEQFSKLIANTELKKR